MGQRADEIAAPRHQQGEKGGDNGAPLYLLAVPDAVIFMYHLGQAPGAEAGHQQGGNQGHSRFPRQGRHFVGFHVVRHVGKALAQAAHLGGQHHQHNQGGNANHHHKALDEIRFQGSHVASQHQQQGRSDGNNNHTYLFVNAQNNRADTCKPLINRGGIGDKEHKNYDAGEKPHGRALKALFKKLGHGFDIVPPGDFPGTVCQHQPGQKGAENRVPNAHQHAP